MDWKKYFILDVISLHQDMITACDEHDMATLHFLLFDPQLNGHELISRSIQSQDYFSTHVCYSDNYDLLQLIFDKNKVPNGVSLSVDELSVAVTSIKDLRIVDFLIQQFKLSKDNIDYDNTTEPEIEFVRDALESSMFRSATEFKI